MPKLRKILKEFGFTYSRKQWTYVERVEDYALTEEEMLFFQQPISSVETYAEPFQLQPDLVQQLQVICDKNNILLEQFVEEVLLEAIQQLEGDDSRNNRISCQMI